MLKYSIKVCPIFLLMHVSHHLHFLIGFNVHHMLSIAMSSLDGEHKA